MTLAIPDQLADVLRTLARRRGVSVEELGAQALAVGLTTLTHDAPDAIVDIGSTLSTADMHTSTITMRSPLITHGPIRPLQITFEPDPEAPVHAH